MGEWALAVSRPPCAAGRGMLGILADTATRIMSIAAAVNAGPAHTHTRTHLGVLFRRPAGRVTGGGCGGGGEDGVEPGLET